MKDDNVAGNRFPVFKDSIEEYLEEMVGFTKERQKCLLSSVRHEFGNTVKAYWYTYMITGLIHSSYLNHHENDEESFIEHFKKWAGLWVRIQESLNILLDSMILGLEGRTTSASSLLRPALESIITGAFYYCLSQEEYRQKAEVLRISDIGRKNTKFLDIVDMAINGIKDGTTIPMELERQVTRIALESDPQFRVPKYEKMVEQIKEWDILETEDVELRDFLYNTMFGSLSRYSHSLYETSYASRGLESKRPDIMFGWSVDPESFQEYASYFEMTCILILLFFLVLTTELQETESFSLMISNYFKDNPDVFSVLGSIPDQIQQAISSK